MENDRDKPPEKSAAEQREELDRLLNRKVDHPDYSELTDPEKQRAKLAEELAKRQRAGKTADRADELAPERPETVRHNIPPYPESQRIEDVQGHAQRDADGRNRLKRETHASDSRRGARVEDQAREQSGPEREGSNPDAVERTEGIVNREIREGQRGNFREAGGETTRRSRGGRNGRGGGGIGR